MKAKITRQKLTKKRVDAVKVPAGKTEICEWDLEVRGFFVRALESGIKTYYLKYRMPGGRKATSTQIKIGRHGDMTVEEARQIAREYKGKIGKNIDVQAERKNSVGGLKVSDLITDYLESVDTKKKERTRKEYKRILEKYVPPVLGRKKIDEIKPPDIRRLHTNMSETPYQANRVLAVLSAMFSYAEKNELLSIDNPCKDVEKYKEEQRTDYLSSDELARLNTILNAAENGELKIPRKKTKKKSKTDPVISLYVIAALRMLILTGARLNEILSLKWDDVDGENSCLNLEDSKTGAKTIHLEPDAMTVLKKLPRVKDNDYVFVGHRTGKHLVNIQKPWGFLREKAKIRKIRLHDLRHTYASVAAGEGVSLHVLGKILGHSQPATTARYAHIANAPLKGASSIINSRLMEALNGNAKAASTPKS